MDEVILSQPTDIKSLILTIRGDQVLLDSDVAMLYGYETKYINRAVSRNKARFPESFCFQVTQEEFELLSSLRFQNGTSKSSEGERRGGRRYLPYAYTEQGIAMLSGLFDLFQAPREFSQGIFFKGQIYDAFKLIMDIIRSADKSIVIIDNYADDSLLNMLTKKKENVSVTIVASKPSRISQLAASKFIAQYPDLQIIKSDEFHDRFIIVDDSKLYHVGASLKDVGKKCFAMSLIENADMINIIKTKTS